MITNSDARQIRIMLTHVENVLDAAARIADDAGDPKFANRVVQVKTQIANLRDGLRLKVAQNE